MSFRGCLAIFLIALASCGVPPSDSFPSINSESQAVYVGPFLKMPISSGYAWKVNTEAGTGYCGVGCNDSAHNAKFAIDFGRYVQYYNGVSPPRFSDGEVDIAAAASGVVKEVVAEDCVNFDPRIRSCAGAYAHTCRMLIDHGNGYTTRYLQLSL